MDYIKPERMVNRLINIDGLALPLYTKMGGGEPKKV